MDFQAFQPSGPTVAISAPTSSPVTGVQVQPGMTGMISIYICNPVAAAVVIGFGATAAAAQANAVLPNSGTTQTGAIVIAPSFGKAFNFPANTYFSALAASTGGTVYLTGGQGV
jgi:hypothetical protein